MNFRRHPVALSLGLMALVVIAWLILGLRGGGEVSFAGAYRIGTNVDWSRPELRGITLISSNEVLFYRWPSFYRLNLVTGKEALFRMALELPPSSATNVLRWYALASPNGSNLLLTVRTDTSRGNDYLVRWADGKALSVSNSSAYRSAWLPDSSGWIGSRHNKTNELRLHRFDLTGKAIKSILVPADLRNVRVGVTCDGRVVPASLTTYASNGDLVGPELNLADFSRRTDLFRLQTVGRVDWAEIRISPGGDWLMTYEESTSRWPRLDPIEGFPFFTLRDRTIKRMWYASLDGRVRQLIGEMPSRHDGDTFVLMALDWMEFFPDGRSMCFRFGSNLWVRPFDLPRDSHK